MKLDAGITRLHLFCRPRNQPDPVSLTGTNINITDQNIIRSRDLRLRLSDKLKNLLSPLTQNHPLFCKRNPPGTLTTPDKKFLTKLILQVFNLRRKRRL